MDSGLNRVVHCLAARETRFSGKYFPNPSRSISLRTKSYPFEVTTIQTRFAWFYRLRAVDRLCEPHCQCSPSHTLRSSNQVCLSMSIFNEMLLEHLNSPIMTDHVPVHKIINGSINNVSLGDKVSILWIVFTIFSSIFSGCDFIKYSDELFRSDCKRFIYPFHRQIHIAGYGFITIISSSYRPGDFKSLTRTRKRVQNDFFRIGL